MSTHLRLELRRLGAASVVAAHGDIDIATVEKAEATLDVARDGAEVLVLDLHGIEFIDTFGIRLVIEERDRAVDGGYHFAVVRGPGNVQRLFEIAGFPGADARSGP
jgi:anti-anti-sigma factor